MSKDPRIVRNRILKILHKKHPEWVTDEELLLALGDASCEIGIKSLVSELIYLRDYPEKENGYVELREEFIAGTNDTEGFSRITPRGIDLVEKLLPPDKRIASF
jgi:hypothetical protein